MMKTSVFAILLFVAANAAAESPPRLPPTLEPLQKKLFALSFGRVLSTLRETHPEFGLGKDELAAPPYDSKLGRSEWVGSALHWLEKTKSIAGADAAKMEAAAEELFRSYYRSDAFSRVPFLNPLAENFGGTASPEIRTLEPILLPAEYRSNHTLDVHRYVDERFPRPLQDFIKTQQMKLYLDDSDCASAAAYQRSTGFSHFTQFMGTRDNRDSQFLLAFNPHSRQYRFVVCQIYGNDDRSRMANVLGPVFSGGRGIMVHHSHPTSLVEFNREGRDLVIDPKDRVIIGFQGTVWWDLHSRSDDWKRDEITDAGVDVALIYNSKTKEQVISVANIYGDEIIAVLEALYAHGARRFTYLGSAGGLDPKLQIGDI